MVEVTLDALGCLLAAPPLAAGWLAHWLLLLLRCSNQLVNFIRLLDLA